MRAVVVAVAVAGIAAASTLLWLGRAGSELPPAVVVGGVDVGGRSTEEAAALVRRSVTKRLRRPIVVRWNGGRVETSAAMLGGSADVAGALARARRSRGWLSRIAARTGFADKHTLALPLRVDPRAVRSFTAAVATRAGSQPTPARLTWRGGKLVLLRARPGRAVNEPALATTLAHLPRLARVPFRQVGPAVRDSAALAAKQRAERLLTAPPVVSVGGRPIELDATLVRAALGFRIEPPRLALRFDPDVLARHLRPRLRRYERPARDARHVVRGARVVLVPAVPGRTPDFPRLARELAARPGATPIAIPFRPLVPRLTTAEARRMRIREVVSEFTTRYSCCAPRVTNIRRAAAILDGTIIPAGAMFSLNAALGPRTPERGFVQAPMILGGRLVDDVGGGVSQIATTVYNAAFFAGLLLLEYTPHQFYISRYPVGREATVSWGGPDLVFRNDWPAAVLVKASAGPTSLSVRFYSAKLERRVETETGPRQDERPARVRTLVNLELPPGTRRVVQQGGVPGFAIWYTRKVYRGNKLLRSSRFTVRYDPEDTIVEVGPPKRPPKPNPRQPKASRTKHS